MTTQEEEAPAKPAKKKPAQAPPPPILAAASAKWIRENHHPRLSVEEACAFMAMVFPKSRHQCRALECPIQCPRHPDYIDPEAPPAWSATPPPPMTTAELEAAERGLASVRGLGRLEVAVAPPLDYRLDPVDSADHVPGLEVAVDEDEPLTAAEEAIWQEQVDRWVGPAPAAAAPPPANSSYPACGGCGRRPEMGKRSIMLVMAPANGKPAGTLCSFCYRGDRWPL